MKLWLLFATVGACLSAQAGTLGVANVDFTRGGMLDFKSEPPTASIAGLGVALVLASRLRWSRPAA